MPDSICNGTKSVLDLCERIELSCAALYHFFADQFKAEREYLLLWTKAALEAENRAKQFALTTKLERKVIKSIAIDLVEAEVTFIYIQSVREKIVANPPDLLGALRCALDLEKKLARYRIENVVTFADPFYARSVLNSDGKKQASLEKAYLKLEGNMVEPRAVRFRAT